MKDRNFVKNFIPIFMAYGLALTVAGIIVIISPFGIILKTLLADIAATIVIFEFSRAYKNSSFYDAYWSVAPPVIAAYWLFSHAPDGINIIRTYIVLGLVMWWSLRLTLNWTSRWEGLTHEDWRYPPIREKAGKYEMMADFAGIHLFPTLIVFIACLPIYAVMKFGIKPFSGLDIIALIVIVIAILIETVSDIQLHKFIKTKSPETFIKTGLWKYSRHPNYFGELGFWVGLMLFGLAAYPYGWWWIMPGALLIGLMFIFISIPMMDQRSLDSRQGYNDHMKRTSAIVPWVPK